MKNKRETEKTAKTVKTGVAGAVKASTALCGMALAAVMLSGCGKSAAAVEEPEVISVDMPQSERTEADMRTQHPEGGSENEPEQNAGVDNGKEQNNDGQPDTEAENKNKAPETESNGSGANGETDDAQASDKLIGSIRSVGDNSIVISRAFEEASNILAMPADGSPDEELVTILVSDETVYEVRNVKNGGVNGDADVEESEGSFSDCKENVSIYAYGSYEGDGFQAVRIVIYHYV